MSLRNNIFRVSIPLLFAIMCINSFPQPYQRELNSIPVSDPEGLIDNIYSGGHNNLEHQFIDIDGDGDLDIFYLDSDQTFGWFKNTGTKYNAEFKYSLSLPTGLFFSNWFYFGDMDDDGDLDYFTGNSDLMSFYRNDGNATSPLFVLAMDTVYDNLGNPIFSEPSCNSTFVDIDGDNDFDFINGNTAGTLAYYENIGTSENFNLKFITDFWQNIYIGPPSINLLHGASSIDFIDIDDDNDFDLFWGDFFSYSLYVIENQGTANTPDMKRVSDIYPINADSIWTSGYNMPRFPDIDADGDYDLFVSVLYDPTVPQSLMFLRNNGTPQVANHQLITTDYLKTLDVGNNSSPVFVDIDNDNDLDLFLGSQKNPNGSISFLENTGTANNPYFFFADSFFFNITGELNIAPSFGDIDNDGDYDLLVGQFNGTLSLYLNSGTASSPIFTDSILVKNNAGDSIAVGSTAIPLFIDIDNDSDLDLVIGAFNGKFYLYENTGTTFLYQFTLNSSYFAGLDVGDNSAPFLFDYNGDGALDLFSGNRNGLFFYYRNDGSNSNPIWTEVTNKFIDIDFGGSTFPCFVDIDNDTDIDLILGNVKGGLYFYRNTDISNIVTKERKQPLDFEVKAFPNPFNPETQIKLQLPVGQDITVDIFNLLGERVKTLYKGYLSSGPQTFTWNAKNNSGLTLPAGIYLVQVTSNEVQKVIKIVFLK